MRARRAGSRRTSGTSLARHSSRTYSQRERWEIRSSASGFDRMSFSLALEMIGTDMYNSILNGEQHGASQHFTGTAGALTIFIENVRIPFADMISISLNTHFHFSSKKSFKIRAPTNHATSLSHSNRMTFSNIKTPQTPTSTPRPPQQAPQH